MLKMSVPTLKQFSKQILEANIWPQPGGWKCLISIERQKAIAIESLIAGRTQPGQVVV